MERVSCPLLVGTCLPDYSAPVLRFIGVTLHLQGGWCHSVLVLYLSQSIWDWGLYPSCCLN